MMKHLLQVLRVVCLAAGVVLLIVNKSIVKEKPKLIDKKRNQTH